MAKVAVFASVLFCCLTVLLTDYLISCSESLKRSVRASSSSPKIVGAGAPTSQRQNLTAIRLANEHLMQMRMNYRCQTPKPTLVRVKDIYNDPSKEYLPRCTVLHQCNDQSGCCEDSTMRCAPSEGHEVQLFFYAIEVENEASSGRRIPYPVVLTFENHTNCQCEEINHRPRSTRLKSTVPNLNEIDDDEEPVVDESLPTNEQTESTACKLSDCPQPFFARFQADQHRCVCDCFDRDRLCLRIKHGHQRLSSKEARCVRSGACLEPVCSAGGHFDHQEGACVLRQQQNSHHHHQHDATNKLRHHHALRNHHHHQKSVHRLAERD